MKDIVTYVIGYGIVGSLLHALFIKRKLKKIFDYRFNKVDELFKDGK